ncbi:hypothetical protein GCM10027406_33160 [Leifsonia lichenia]
MDDITRRPASRWWVVGALLIAVAAGLVAVGAGWTVWILAAASALCLAAGVAAFGGWSLGVVSAVAVPLAVEAFAIRVFHRIGLGVFTGNLLVFVLIALVGLVLVAASGDRLKLPGRTVWWGVLPAAVVPAMVGGVFAILPALRDGNALSWAMRSDAVWNLVSARFLLDDRGLIPSLHPNSSPMTAILLAAGMAPGRAGIATTDLFQHDIAAMAGVFALATVITSLLAGLVIAQMIRPEHPVFRAIGAVLGSALIASWFVAGFSFEFGFYNVMPTVACLLASWLAWRAAPRAPVIAVALLLAMTTALLALWAFLAIVPLALAAVLAVRHIVRRPRSYGWLSWTILGVAAVQVLAYGVLVSLRDLRRDQGALAQGGSMAPVTPALLFILIGLCVAVAAVTARTAGTRADLVGVVTVSVAFAGLYAYLGTQVQAAAYWWGYYPAKLVWFGGILLLVVAIGLALERLSRVELAVWPRVAATAGVLVAIVSVAASVLPKPPTFGSLLPYADILAGEGVASGDDVLPTMFALDDPADAKNMLVGYFDWKADGFANLWLLGASATGGTDPIRPYSYYLDTTSVKDVCSAVKAWGDGVTIRTRSEALPAKLAVTCPDADVTVVVGRVPVRG